MRKGGVQVWESGVKMTCGGAYWDWPWWKRVLSTLAFWPYGHFGAIKWLMWSLRHPEKYDRLPIALPDWFLYQTVYSQYSSRVRPIYWAMDFGGASNARQRLLAERKER